MCDSASHALAYLVRMVHVLSLRWRDTKKVVIGAGINWIQMHYATDQWGKCTHSKMRAIHISHFVFTISDFCFPFDESGFFFLLPWTKPCTHNSQSVTDNNKLDTFLRSRYYLFIYSSFIFVSVFYVCFRWHSRCTGILLACVNGVMMMMGTR